MNAEQIAALKMSVKAAWNEYPNEGDYRENMLARAKAIAPSVASLKRSTFAAMALAQGHDVEDVVYVVTMDGDLESNELYLRLDQLAIQANEGPSDAEELENAVAALADSVRNTILQQKGSIMDTPEWLARVGVLLTIAEDICTRQVDCESCMGKR